MSPKIPALAASALIAAAVLAPSTSHAAYPGASGRIAWSGNVDGNYDIFSIHSYGGGDKQLTNTSGLKDNFMPAYSPNGKGICFTSNRDGDLEIFVMSADGSHETRLTRDSVSDINCTWSPDGKKIAYERSSGGGDIWVMDADGGNQTRLTRGPGADEYPAWSPLGKRIAFDSMRGGDTDTEIYTMSATGTRLKQITDDSVGEWDADWSPDGKKLVLVSDAGGDPEIFWMNSDGSGGGIITNNSVVDEAPVYSPDGTFVAYVEVVPIGSHDIFIASSTDGSGATNITASDAVENLAPTWQPK